MANAGINGKKRYFIPAAVLTAIVALCIGIFSYINWKQVYRVDTVVILDVNPSVSLQVNVNEKIISAQGLNKDGVAVLGSMDLAGVNLDVAVNAIIGSMLQKGYLSEMQNAVLVSVENEDAEKSARLQARISAAIDSIFEGTSLDGAVLSQGVEEASDLEQLAQEFGISLGKAALIREVAGLDSTLTVAELAELSINEIALISQSRDMPSETVTQVGSVSDKAYIGREAAETAAYAYAKVSAGDVTRLKVDFDSDDGVMVYEVEFYVGDVEYDCDVNALTGEVVKYKTEYRGTSPAGNPISGNSTSGDSGNGDGITGNGASSGNMPGNGASSPASRYIGEDAARNAALENACLQEGDVDYINVWLDYDDGHPEYYKVEFKAGNVDYEYEIDMYSGAVLSQSIESHEHHNEQHDTRPDAGAAASGADIGVEAAKSAALAHAGLEASMVTKLKAEYDIEDGVAIYEVEFDYGRYEYEYEIDAATGVVLKYKIDD